MHSRCHLRGEVARRVAVEWLVRDPQNHEAHYILALVAYSRGEYATALEHVRKVNAKDPNYSRVRELTEHAAKWLGRVGPPAGDVRGRSIPGA